MDDALPTLEVLLSRTVPTSRRQTQTPPISRSALSRAPAPAPTASARRCRKPGDEQLPAAEASATDPETATRQDEPEGDVSMLAPTRARSRAARDAGPRPRDERSPCSTPVPALALAPTGRRRMQRRPTANCSLRGQACDDGRLLARHARVGASPTYLDAWKRRIERVGTLNFPNERAQRRPATPCVEVAIRADGTLESVHRAPHQRAHGTRPGGARHRAARRAVRPVSDRAAQATTRCCASPTNGSSSGGSAATARSISYRPACAILSRHVRRLPHQPVPDRDAGDDRSELRADGDARLRTQRTRRARHRHQPHAADDARRCVRPARARPQPVVGRRPAGAARRARADRSRFRPASPAGSWESSLPFSERIHLTTSRDILDAMAAATGPTVP